MPWATDRCSLGSLPNEIVRQILSLVSIRDAMRTQKCSLLSPLATGVGRAECRSRRCHLLPQQCDVGLHRGCPSPSSPRLDKFSETEISNGRASPPARGPRHTYEIRCRSDPSVDSASAESSTLPRRWKYGTSVEHLDASVAIVV